jgi:hypothetical protein
MVAAERGVVEGPWRIWYRDLQEWKRDLQEWKRDPGGDSIETSRSATMAAAICL